MTESIPEGFSIIPKSFDTFARTPFSTLLQKKESNLLFATTSVHRLADDY
tara:strand:- start:10101 stop:10250 length:150 start_codon:yes stop_codon:yes gene_type:complete